MRRLLLIFIIIPLFNITAQSLSSNLSKVAADYAKLYLQPFADAAGAELNSGLFFSSMLNPVDENKLNISFSLESAVTVLPASEQSFNASYNDTVMYNYNGQYYPVNGQVTVKNAPTIFGSKTPGIANVDINSSIYILPGISYPVKEKRTEQTIGGLYNSTYIPIVIPQIEVGSYEGTSLVVRGLLPIKIGNFGKLNFWGFGLRHNIKHDLKSLPFNLALGIIYQNLSLSDTTNNDVGVLNTFALNLYTSKSFGIFDVYGGLQFESATLKANYSYYNNNSQNPYTVTIDFSLKGKNLLRGVAGIAVLLGNFYTDLDLNLSNFFSVSLGINYSIL